MTYKEFKKEAKHCQGSHVSIKYFSIFQLFLILYYTVYFIFKFNETSYPWNYISIAAVCIGWMLFIFQIRRNHKLLESERKSLTELYDFLLKNEDDKIHITHSTTEDRISYFLSNNNEFICEYQFDIYSNKLAYRDYSNNRSTKEHKLIGKTAFNKILNYHNTNFDSIVRPIIEKSYNKEKEMYELYQ